MAMSRSDGSSAVTSRPPIRMRPSVGVSSPATSRSSVDLPQPEAPTMTSISPSFSDRSFSAAPGYRRNFCARLEFERRHLFLALVRPATNQRCISTTTRTGGNSASTVVAVTAPQSVWVSWPIILDDADNDGVQALIGRHQQRPRYWFQPKTNGMADSAAILAAETGGAISHRKRSGPAPSMRAASTSSWVLR